MEALLMKVTIPNSSRFLLVLTLIVLSISVVQGETGCDRKRVFDGEEDGCLDKAPSPPPLVVASILDTETAKESLEEIAEPAARAATASKLLKGLIVHLHNTAQNDMIVRGERQLTGGDNTWFWIVTSVDDHPYALWVQGNVVTILGSRNNGYSDIRTDWAAGSHSATRLFRYDGHRYKLFRQKYQDLPPG